MPGSRYDAVVVGAGYAGLAAARRSWHRQGFRRKRPRKRLVKANPAAQQAFAQALQHREQHRAPGSVTVSMDQGQIWQDA